MNKSQVSSPAATGGAGMFFEQNVGAYWLVQLLVRAIPPILRDCTVSQIYSQSEHLGWHTDDFLVVGETSQGEQRKLAVQVKRTFTVSAADDECKKAMQDFWKDFCDTNLFSATTDRLVLVTLRGTNVLLENFCGLLDCARSSSDTVDFEHRLGTQGFISAKSRNYWREIKTIIAEIEGRIVPEAEIWPFLCVLHLLSLDLNTPTKQTETQMKTLLAYTADGHNPIGIADASWNELLRVAGEAIPNARSFRRDDLPAVLRARHSPLGGTEHRVLEAMKDHSIPILDGIRPTIGINSLHLERRRLVWQVIERMESTQVVLISGAAGIGKSCVAKCVVDILAADHFVFSFRAEEFAYAHLDETLKNSSILANTTRLSAVLASQNHKVLLVESVERLLEKSTRDAFMDLLTLVARDTNWRLVLTCRDYSVDLICASFLAPAGVGVSVVSIPELDDEELADVENAYPVLTHPLHNPRLRRILRNAFFLDKALKVSWSVEKSLPQNEWEFRMLFWREIVCDNCHPAGGMTRRRNETFMQIALRRARALDLYADCSDLDPEVIELFRRDSLIVFSQQSDALAAPAHDVLEDWAILQWIEEQYARKSDSIQEFSVAIGTYPAVRRTYRKWVGEIVERRPEAVDKLFQGVICEKELTAQFRDDTFVSLLRSASAPEFLEQHATELFANEHQLFSRIIHLLRVACVTMPNWLNGLAVSASLLNIPDGNAWASVLRLLQNHLSSFTEKDGNLLLGLIEDWGRGVSVQNPYPDGAESVAVIAYSLLPFFGDYRLGNQRKRVLQVIAKIPNADRDHFSVLLNGNSADEQLERMVQEFREVVFDGLEGMPAARDMPELVVSAARDYLLLSEVDLRHESNYKSSLDPEMLFGIKSARCVGSFPASAYRGPYYSLLCQHPVIGLRFIMDVINFSAEWYSKQISRNECIDCLSQVTLTFTDGTTKRQWCNSSLWNLYRGTSIGPDVLKSLLMALEQWLLDLAKEQPQRLDEILLKILRKSESTALTAVVASVATAFPDVSGEALLVMLRSPKCIRLDRERLVYESQAPSKLLGSMFKRNMGNDFYVIERETADKLPHRRDHLEIAITKLQFGPMASQVHEILDQYRASMPPVEQQDEDDRLWRLALHRMDLRQYQLAEDNTVASSALGTAAISADDTKCVRLALKAPDPDVKEMVDQSAASIDAKNASLGLLLWGVKVFGREDDPAYDTAQWRKRLQQARSVQFRESEDEDYDLGQGAPGIAAAVCVRDHWEEMSEDERKWCVKIVCLEIERQADCWDRVTCMQRNCMSPDRQCAQVLPLLLGKPLDEDCNVLVRQTYAVALTHAIDEVRLYAAGGGGQYLWIIDRDLTLLSVNAMATEAILVQREMEADSERPYEERREIEQIRSEVASVVRRQFYEVGSIASDAYDAMDSTEWFGADANGRILSILGQAPTESVTIAGFARLAQTLVAWWNGDEDRRRSQNVRQRERGVEVELGLSCLLQEFLLRASEAISTTVIGPVLDAVDRYPQEVSYFILGLMEVEDRRHLTSQFWTIWELFAERVRRAKWLVHLDDEHSMGDSMISAIFLGSSWKKEVRHWCSLEGYAHHVHTLFEELPASAKVFDCYCRFLYHIGEQSLPEAFLRIASQLRQHGVQRMTWRGDTVFMLEILLQRYVYGRPLELKKCASLRDAVLFLLDLLVENGSSAAFKMRDDFVTPLPAT